jgi:hypothetical protein
MLTKIIIVVVVLLVIIIASSILIIFKPIHKHHDFSGEHILSLFDKENVISVEYIRNKIVVLFKNVELFEVRKLKQDGAKGINIVGDKLKFFVSDDAEINKKMYNELLNHIER